MRILVVLICGLLTVFLSHISIGQRYTYDFDQCNLSEISGLLADAVSFGNPSCECGPNNDALAFDGLNDYLEMPTPGSLLQQDNYSFSFYLRPTGIGSNVQQIFTNQRQCGDLDSLFSIQYFPSIQTVAVRISDFGATKGLIEAPLDPQKCWQQVTLVKQGRILQLFVNGIQESQFDGNQPVNIFSDAPIKVAYTDCTPAQNIVSFMGLLDEIKWYDRALTPAEVLQEYDFVDEIVTRDTLIFKGDQFIPSVSSSCANSVLWSPSVGLSNSNIIDPVIGPDTTTGYNVSFSYSGCTASDSLKVVVIDPDQIDCDKLLLPSAFTPNGDNLNDAYGISNAFIVDELIQFDIMDRMGHTLFSATAASDEWLGDYRGQQLPNGIYVYKVAYMCKGDKYAKTGSFNIIR